MRHAFGPGRSGRGDGRPRAMGVGWIKGFVLFALAILLAVPAALAAQPTKQTLFNFDGSDGRDPASAIVADPEGNLYSATTTGGHLCKTTPFSSPGCGVVLELSPPADRAGAWRKRVLYRFTGGVDGAFPGATLVRGDGGTLYGTTYIGGNGPIACLPPATGCGTVFSLTPPVAAGATAWTLRTLYSFQYNGDGGNPLSLTAGPTPGTLVGAAEFTAYGIGQALGCGLPLGHNCGLVFQLTPPAVAGGAWTETILHAFTGIPKGATTGDGERPFSIVGDSRGGYVGATLYGGKRQFGSTYGALFGLTPPAGGTGPWSETVVFSFPRLWGYQNSDLAADREGNVFGNTDSAGYAVIYELTGGKVAPLRAGAHTPKTPRFYNGMTTDAAGNLYGVNGFSGTHGWGSVFELLRPASAGAHWSSKLLYSFAGGPDGQDPTGALALVGHTLFGTTRGGGSVTGRCVKGGLGCGTVFSLDPTNP